MSIDPDLPSGWTLAAYIAHNEALREAEERFQAERDRRYAEISIEKEKALRIKEEADKAALGLAREIQTYKDEKANELREQISRERGDYITRTEYTTAHVALIDKLEAAVTPLQEFMVQSRGKSQGIGASAGVLLASIGAIATILAIVSTVIVLVTR